MNLILTVDSKINFNFAKLYMYIYLIKVEGYKNSDVNILV